MSSAQVCTDALQQRYQPEEYEEAEARLNEELQVIANHKLAGFFLLYRDLLEMAREVAGEVRGESPGRDSSATCRRDADGDHRSARSSAT